MIVIETKKLSKIYTHDFIDVEHGRLRFNWFRRTTALHDLDLQVREGEIFGLLGPNGAGKSTTIKILMQILYPSSGSARIMERPLGDKAVKGQIGFLPENPAFYDYLKGHEFLDYYGVLYGMSKSERRKRINKAGIARAFGKRFFFPYTANKPKNQFVQSGGDFVTSCY